MNAGIDGGPARGRGLLTPAVVLSLMILAGSAAAAVAFVAARGGLELAGGPAPSGAPPSTAPTRGATPAPTEAPTAAPTPVPSSAPSASPEATVSPTQSPAPSPAPTSDRYALLEPCPSAPDCYRYTVRIGDNLSSIASYFGVSYAVVLDRNPQIVDPATIQPGDVLTLPTPTR